MILAKDDKLAKKEAYVINITSRTYNENRGSPIWCNVMDYADFEDCG